MSKPTASSSNTTVLVPSHIKTSAVSVEQPPAKPVQKTPNVYPFWLGGVASSIAVCFTHPLDLARVRLQNSPTKMSTGQLICSTIAGEGVRGLYIGLSASILRQMTYSLTRFAAYEEMKNYVQRTRFTDKPIPMWITISAASLAGAAGGIAGNPADLVLVRMTSDLFREPSQRFQYRNCFDGVMRIIKDEGVRALFRGWQPNTVRAALMNASQLASYDFFKDLLLSTGLFTNGTLAHYLTSSLLAGTVATTITSPADVVRSRLMNVRGTESGVPQLLNAMRSEGPMFLFRGWVPSWMRLAPQTVIVLTLLEELRHLVDYCRGT